MEFEERNPKPQETSKNLPVVVLGALIGIICLLLYVGWHFMSDDASNASEITDEPVKAVGEFDSEGKDETEATVTTESTPAPAEEEPVVELPKKTEKVAEPKEEKPAEKTSAKGEFTSHLVESGETFNGIANRYNVSVSTLKNNNSGIEPSGIKVGVTKLRVPVQTVHTVGPGDVLRVVAKKYDISLDLLMKANGKTKNFAQRGEKLVIPKKNKE